MSLCALTAIALAASPSWSIIITRRVGVDAPKAAELAEQLQRALNAIDGAPLGSSLPMKEATSLPEACKTFSLDRLVGLQLIKLGADVALDATLFECAGEKSLGAVTAQLSAATTKRKLEDIAAKLAAKAPLLVTPLPDPEPVAATPPPAPAPSPAPAPAVSVAAERPTPTIRYLSYGLAGGAIVSAGLAIGLGVVALQQGGAVKNIDADFSMRRSAALGMAMGADICWGLAAAFAVGAVVTFILGLD